MGGRASEEIFTGTVTTGALNDLERATKMATTLVLYYGMSDRLPNISYYDSSGQAYGFSKPYSEERARIIDEEVSRILAEQYERAKQILNQYHDGLKELADELFDRETIFTADVERIFGPRQWTSRTDQIIAEQKQRDADKAPEATPPADTHPSAGDTVPAAPSDINLDKPSDPTPPPFPGDAQ